MARSGTSNGNGKSKRDYERVEGGRFAKGNQGGPGNPWTRLTQNLRTAICEAASKPGSKKEFQDRAAELAEILWEMALGVRCYPDDKSASAQRWAMQQILDRALGKPKETHEIEGSAFKGFAEAIAEWAERSAYGRDR